MLAEALGLGPAEMAEFVAARSAEQRPPRQPSDSIAASSTAAARFLPTPLTPFVGRERELAAAAGGARAPRRAAPDGDRPRRGRQDPAGDRGRAGARRRLRGRRPLRAARAARVARSRAADDRPDAGYRRVAPRWAPPRPDRAARFDGGAAGPRQPRAPARRRPRPGLAARRLPRASRCSSPVARRCTSPASTSSRCRRCPCPSSAGRGRSRRSRRPTRSGCLSIGPRRSRPGSGSPRPMPGTRPRSAAGWTGCRWPSSWPPPGSRPSRPTRSWRGSSDVCRS